MKQHYYEVNTNWIGNLGTGTNSYQGYSRNFEINSPQKNHIIQCSSDKAFHGDETLWNPEELFIASISSCHQLWYLHLCAVNNIVVMDYLDHTHGIMVEYQDQPSRFKKIILNPTVKISSQSDIKLAIDLHKKAHQECFLANSVNFDIECIPYIQHYFCE